MLLVNEKLKLALSSEGRKLKGTRKERHTTACRSVVLGGHLSFRP
jgi:hypothetical protein